MSVDQALGKVREAAGSLEVTSTQLQRRRRSGLRRGPHRRGDASAVASGNVTTAAELRSKSLPPRSARSPARPTARPRSPRRAVKDARRTVHTMSELGDAATRIGEVVGLIQAIAGQTNLLALNATIEARHAPAKPARASRSWPRRSSRSPARPPRPPRRSPGQVGAIQSAVADAAQAIEQVNGIIEEISDIAATVAVTRRGAEPGGRLDHRRRQPRIARKRAAAPKSISRVAGTSSDARAVAADVKVARRRRSRIEAESLNGEVRRFLADVQAT